MPLEIMLLLTLAVLLLFVDFRGDGLGFRDFLISAIVSMYLPIACLRMLGSFDW